jgi:hypothetical protein
VGLEQGLLSLVNTVEELLGSNLESWEYGRGHLLRWPCDTFYPQKLALTSLTSGCSVGIVRLHTKATEFNLSLLIHYQDRLCGLVVRVLGYRSGGPGSITGATKKKKKKVVGLERGPLRLVSTTEELLDRKVGAPV